MTVEEHLQVYHRLYSLLRPDAEALESTQALWTTWNKAGHEKPDVAGIHRDYRRMEDEFFRELAECAVGREGRLPLHQLPFCLGEYNCCAWSAEDGYIVLVDENFFGLLFMLCVLVALDTFGHVQEAEAPAAQAMMRRVLEDHWVGHAAFYMREHPLIYELMKRDYEAVELGNYLFQSFKAFILLHEIGHHALGHTAGRRNLVWRIHGDAASVAVDSHEHAKELEADAYALRYFLELLRSQDNSRQTFFKYTMPFAPELFFQIAERLDRFKAARIGRPAGYESHPHPERRIAALREAGMPVDEDLYVDLLESVERYLPLG